MEVTEHRDHKLEGEDFFLIFTNIELKFNKIVWKNSTVIVWIISTLVSFSPRNVVVIPIMMLK